MMKSKMQDSGSLGETREPSMRFIFQQEIRDAGNWLAYNGTSQINRIKPDDLNKIVCLSEVTLGLKISGVSSDGDTYSQHISELVRLLEAKHSELGNPNNMRVVAWAVLALESCYDENNFINRYPDIFNKGVARLNSLSNILVGITNQSLSLKFSVYDVTCSLLALSKVKKHNLVPERDIKEVIEKGIKELLSSRKEDGGYPFKKEEEVSRISITAFVLFVLDEIRKIDSQTGNYYKKEDIDSSVDYLFKNYSLWLREDFEMTAYYPYPFVYFALGYVITALFNHKVGFRAEIIDGLSELYNLRKDGGFAMERGGEPIWYSTFDAIQALKTVAENIVVFGKLSEVISYSRDLLEENKKSKKEHEDLKKEIIERDKNIDETKKELNRIMEENKKLNVLLKKERGIVLSGRYNICISPPVLVSVFIGLIMTAISALIIVTRKFDDPFSIGWLSMVAFILVVMVVMKHVSKNDILKKALTYVNIGVVIGLVTTIFIYAWGFNVITLLASLFAIFGGALIRGISERG